jgi:hypothetical protein
VSEALDVPSTEVPNEEVALSEPAAGPALWGTKRTRAVQVASAASEVPHDVDTSSNGPETASGERETLVAAGFLTVNGAAPLAEPTGIDPKL